jgi:hypothetical protein
MPLLSISTETFFFPVLPREMNTCYAFPPVRHAPNEVSKQDQYQEQYTYVQ